MALAIVGPAVTQEVARTRHVGVARPRTAPSNAVIPVAVPVRKTFKLCALEVDRNGFV